MVIYQQGFYEKNIPFLKGGHGNKNIVLLSGGGNSLWSIHNNAKSFMKMLDGFLPKGYQYYVLGYQKKIPKKYNMQKIANDMSFIIDKHIGKSVLIGSSYGGIIGMYVSANYPDLVDKLILNVSAHSLSKNGINIIKKAIRLAKSNNVKEIYKETILFFRSDLRRYLAKAWFALNKKNIIAGAGSKETFINALEALLHYSQYDDKQFIKKIKTDTLIFGGDKDQFFSKETFKETAQHIPNAKLKLFPNEAHYLTYERKKEVKSIMHKFMSKKQSV
jgi:pimeloyl-ACP methyl ester carboxylesterase